MSDDPSYVVIRAVRFGNLARVKKLIDSYGLSYSKAWSDGYILLREAIRERHRGVAKFLINAGSKVNSKNIRSTDTPLHLAARNNDSEIVDMLLARGANPNAIDRNGDTPLHFAVKKRNPQIIKSLLEKRARVNATSKRGMTPLHLSAEIGDADIAKLLLKCGASVNLACFSSSSSCKFNGYAPLHIATSKANDTIVKLLLRNGADINARTSDKSTSLHLAVEMKHDKIVKLLLSEANCDFKAEDNNANTPLHVAIEKGKLSNVQRILKRYKNTNKPIGKKFLKAAVLGPDRKICKEIIEKLVADGITVNSDDANNQLLLEAAIEKGETKIIRDLLNYGADVNLSKNDKEGFFPLHNAARFDRIDIAKLLIKHGAEVNAKSKSGVTPLFCAIEKKSVKMTKLLLSNGAIVKYCRESLHTAVKTRSRDIMNIILSYGEIDIDARDKQGFSALHYTVMSDISGSAAAGGVASRKKCSSTSDGSVVDDVELEMAAEILNHGADVDARCNDGSSVLDYAAALGKTGMVELLLKFNADVNRSDYDKSPLHYCAKQGSEAVTMMLLNKGARIDAREKNGKTALHIACEYGNDRVVAQLLDNGADIDSRDNNDSSPLQIAAEHGTLVIVKKLLNNFANLEFRDKRGRTALHIAAKQSWPEAAEELLEHGSDVNVTCKSGNTPLDYALLGAEAYNERRDERLCFRFDYDRPFHFDPDDIDGDYFNNHSYRYDDDDDDVDDDDDDVDDYSDTDFYDFFDDNYSLNSDCRTDHLTEIIEQHIVKIKAINGKLSRRNIESIDIASNHQDFNDDCIYEADTSRNEKISDTSVTFYDLMTGDIGQMAIYARNKIIKDTVESGLWREKFPIYANWIYNNFKRGEKRESLLVSSATSLNFLCGFVLPELSSAVLLSYLDNNDLKSLIKAAVPADDTAGGKIIG